MCGIVAVLLRASTRAVPPASVLATGLEAARTALGGGTSPHQLQAAAADLGRLDAMLRGTAGLSCMLSDPAALEAAAAGLEDLQQRIARIEADFDRQAEAGAELEQRNAAMLALKDACWALLRDRVPHARAVAGLAGTHELTQHSAAAFSALQVALASLDRLEVRGRDSAGVGVVVKGVDLSHPAVKAALQQRDHELFTNRSVRTGNGTLQLVYKHAAEIGELGDNVRALRNSMASDDLLQWALRQPGAEPLVLAHTRWASIGIISEPNAHPLNEQEVGTSHQHAVLAVLNGDVDNHEELKRRHQLAIADEITTDTKVIPALVSRELALGTEFAEAFRRTVATFEGSVAIAVGAAAHPDRVALALRGSGQALYVGLREDGFVVASEPYGVVEECSTYLRMDGETPGNPQNPTASRGQVVVLDRAHAGTVAGIRRTAYDGTELPVAERQLTRAAVTTRDIDRAGFRHFLHKEISESPGSFHKTLRGRVVARGNRLQVALPTSSLPEAVTEGLAAGRYRRIRVIGQGTAAVAGQAVAAALEQVLARAPIEVRALPATELSGFGLRDDMTDTLVVAISQSGTTTDTNRTVDLLRQRGAAVLAIVNRRGSDLCDKADGVLFTSDGRDIEMSVASTKAFYSQCAAGWLLALAIARAAGVADDRTEHELITALQQLPDRMRQVLAQDESISAVAARVAPQRKHWALAGNGANRIAAAEIRIKLSELCYKSMACDATEDKKHIDLSSEPLILVCAAGLTGSTADDVAKEVAIFRAHKALPVVIATEGEDRFTAAAATIHVPATHPALAFVLSTMAGHLFGYRAALAIDSLALPLRAARGAIEQVVDDPILRTSLLQSLQPRIQPHWEAFRRGLAQGRYDGVLSPSTGVRLSSLLSYAMGIVPIDSYGIEFGEPGAPGTVVDALAEELTRAIDQLTRPVDAIKHQAKTVTVGISRADEALLSAPLVRAVFAAGAARDHLGYRDLRALAALDAAVLEVTGSTRYRIAGDPESGDARIAVLEQRGVAATLPSRTSANPVLKGTKHLVAVERLCFVARGRSDGRTVILVPEVEHGRTTGITLVHVRFADHLDPKTMRGVLSAYRNRLSALTDAVTETEPSFDESVLGRIGVADLLTEPVNVLADRWRAMARG
ncbi:MAG: hypothetical protein RL148_3213 [Planctomycetota bacterium]